MDADKFILEPIFVRFSQYRNNFDTVTQSIIKNCRLDLWECGNAIFQSM